MTTLQSAIRLPHQALPVGRPVPSLARWLGLIALGVLALILLPGMAVLAAWQSAPTEHD